MVYSDRQLAILVLTVAPLLSGCAVKESQLVWNYQMVSVCEAIYTAGRERPDDLFHEGQVELLLGQPDTLVHSLNSKNSDERVLQAAAASFAQYERQDYTRSAEALLPLSPNESDAFEACRLWVYREEQHYTSPLPGCSFARYVIVLKDGIAISSAIVPKE